jgi:uncharacterized C2H2 Zn-finger protein
MYAIPYSYRTLSCPKCGKVIKFGFTKFALIPVSSGLGPRLVMCPRCQATFESGLEEWVMMKPLRKVRYVILSLVYALSLGFLFAFIAVMIWGLMLDPEAPVYLVLESPRFLILLLTVGFAVLCVQTLRVYLSIKRTTEGLGPFRASFWSWQTNLQFWVMLLMIAGLLLGFLWSRLR